MKPEVRKLKTAMYPLRLYIKNPVILTLVIFGGVVNLAAWLWLVLHLHPQTEPFFLHYNILFGVDEIGTWSHIFFVPLGGLAISLLNIGLGWMLFHEDKYAAYFLAVVSCIVQVFILIALALLVALNV